MTPADRITNNILVAFLALDAEAPGAARKAYALWVDTGRAAAEVLRNALRNGWVSLRNAVPHLLAALFPPQLPTFSAREVTESIRYFYKTNQWEVWRWHRSPASAA